MLNQPAPDFALPDLNGKIHRLSNYRGVIVLINFWSAECPWSAYCDAEIQSQGIAWGEQVTHLRVASNRNESEALLMEVANSRGLDLILKDSNAVVADLYQAQTTPHLFVVDRNGILRYAGGFSDQTYRQRVARRFYLKEAMEAVLSGHTPSLAQVPPYGCAIVREV